MHEYFARKMAALQQARIAKLMQDPDEVTVAVKEVDMFVSPLPFPPIPSSLIFFTKTTSLLDLLYQATFYFALNVQNL